MAVDPWARKVRTGNDSAKKKKKRSLIPGHMPTHGLKVLGPLAETGNLSTPRQGESTLPRNPYKMRQTTAFYLIKNFCSSQPLLPPSFKIWTSVWVQDSETKQL